MAEPPRNENRPPRRWQFGIGAMFLWMTVVAVLSAGVGGLLQLGSGWRAHGPEVFLVLLIAAPLGLMIVLSLIDGLRKRPTRPRRPSQPAPKGPHEEGPDET